MVQNGKKCSKQVPADEKRTPHIERVVVDAICESLFDVLQNQLAELT